uniref:Uncharacterized protein n=1 Tax=Cacopsylla melanoneura TaxID=428564 RepID=A0A8D8ZB93_9HEMI
MRHTKLQVENLYRLFEQKRCEMKGDIIKNLLTLARFSPDDFAYQYFNAPGHSAIVRGEVIYVFRCDPIVVSPISTQPDCYNELSVLYNNETWFMSPRTQDYNFD